MNCPHLVMIYFCKLFSSFLFLLSLATLISGIFWIGKTYYITSRKNIISSFYANRCLYWVSLYTWNHVSRCDILSTFFNFSFLQVWIICTYSEFCFTELSVKLVCLSVTQQTHFLENIFPLCKYNVFVFPWEIFFLLFFSLFYTQRFSL